MKRERASERKLDLFPLQRITSSDVILARTSQDAACSAACQTVKILFAPREIGQWFGNGMEEENTPKLLFGLLCRKTFAYNVANWYTIQRYGESYFQGNRRQKLVKVWRCARVSVRQRIGNYLPKLLGTQRDAYKENFSS